RQTLPPPSPPSFPTRRSSDLPNREQAISPLPSLALRISVDSVLTQPDPPTSPPAGAEDRQGRTDAEGRVNRRYLNSQAGVNAIQDRKSTRLNSSHQIISYAVF